MGEPLEYESIFEKTFVENVQYIWNEHIVRKVNEGRLAAKDEDEALGELYSYMEKSLLIYCQINLAAIKEEEGYIMWIIQDPIQHLIKEGLILVLS